jgi:hypothetical protein
VFAFFGKGDAVILSLSCVVEGWKPLSTGGSWPGRSSLPRWLRVLSMLQGLGFRVKGLGKMLQGLGFKVKGLGVKVLGFRLGAGALRMSAWAWPTLGTGV